MRPESVKKQKSSFIKTKGAAISLLALALPLAGCGEEKPVAETIRPVKAMVVEAALPDRAVTYSGVIAPRIETALGFRVGGKIVERLVDVGQTVKDGQPVARLDETDLKLSENSAKAAVASAKTRLAVAKDALERAKALRPNGYISQAVVDQRQLEFDSAKAALDSAEDQYDQAKNATSYALLKADRDGIVTSVRAEPGQVVSVGQPVVTLAQAGDIEAEVALPEQEITQLKVGQKAQVSLWANPDVRSQGTIREIAGAADPASRTYAVRVAVENPAPAMRLGMTANVTLRLPAAPNAVTVPLTALSEQNGGKAVFVADAQTETVSARPVRVAGVSEAGAKIADGLMPGDVVVTGGVQFLRDGMRIRLPDDLKSLAEVTAATASN